MRKLYWTCGTALVLLLIGCALLVPQLQPMSRVSFFPGGVQFDGPEVQVGPGESCWSNVILTIYNGYENGETCVSVGKP